MNNINLFLLVLLLVSWALFAMFIFVIYYQHNCPNNIYNPIIGPNTPIQFQSNSQQPTPQTQQTVPSDISYRDSQVLNNPLYPPVNRQDIASTIKYINEPRLYQTDVDDRYRLVAYLVNIDDKNDVWKLFAKEKYRRSIADFYAVSANKNIDVKIALSNEMTGNKLRDLYDLPYQLSINHSLFAPTPYDVIKLPMNDLSSGYL